MWGKVYDKLKEKGLNPYQPGKHKGLCEERYCVVKYGSQVPFPFTNKIGYKIIDIILYIPINDYEDVEEYAKKIRYAMKELKSIRKTGNETPVITEDEKEAYTMSIQYQILKELEG